jgi:hypothetical protein
MFSRYPGATTSCRLRALDDPGAGEIARDKAAGKHCGRPFIDTKLAGRIRAALAEPGARKSHHRASWRIICARSGSGPRWWWDCTSSARWRCWWGLSASSKRGRVTSARSGLSARASGVHVGGCRCAGAAHPRGADLVDRGLNGVQLIISDACRGLMESAAVYLPDRWQELCGRMDDEVG